ncbi:acylase [Methylosinus sporium]|uniref:Acylase n=1 Tax=Methylosinus sporium TaxID=428 RepID=A0A549T1T4_METSR|nr:MULTISPECIES: acylase [Methylosinus]MBU3890342.1 acylase [Methylosinus sp. KRF6]TRL35818.1 acylase [Methylosinus sporium]
MSRITKRDIVRACLSIFVLSLAYAGAASFIRARESVSDATVEIRWTSHGIPHIRAVDERGLGYGVGYAYAQDNICLLAEEILTVAGERSKYLGADAMAAAAITNLESDFFFRWLNNDEAIAEISRSQPRDVRELLSGYAAGYNRYLRDAGIGGLPSACRDKRWVRPISDIDLLKNMRRLLVQSGLGRFMKAVVAAAPPSRGAARSRSGELTSEAVRFAFQPRDAFESSHGSNAIAVGKELSRNGKGLLLANPHYPWTGPLRFYQMHLTIPGKLDVMGASLPGLPMINIGFTQNLAWTHTVDTSSHFVSYRLRLDPADPTRYLVEGESLPMRKTSVVVDVLEKDGSLTQRSHDFYQSGFGPVFDLPDQFRWDESRAFVIEDANLGNGRALQQWYAMNRATSLDQFQSSITRIVGIPWVNTIAVDADGTTLFMNVSAIPNVDAAKLSSCRPSDPERPSSVEFPVLDGTRKACEWDRTPAATQEGLFPGDSLPILRREDFVLNSNDSAWLANPARPLTGFSPLVSREKVELGGRARYALEWLRHRLEEAASRGARLDAEDLQDLLMRDHVYVASLIMDDLLTLCPEAIGEEAEGADKLYLATACEKLRVWNRTADLDANMGYVYLEGFMERARKIANAWRVPFDSSRPLDTPHGLNIDDPEVAKQLMAALSSSVREAASAGFAPDATWGQIQVASRGGRAIPIHGGSGALGVYNVIRSTPSGKGRREVVSGSSYIQIVSFEPSGPRAETLLTFSESLNPDSRYFADQTELFSRKEWVRLPFSETEIEADLSYRRQTIPY